MIELCETIVDDALTRASDDLHRAKKDPSALRPIARFQEGYDEINYTKMLLDKLSR